MENQMKPFTLLLTFSLMLSIAHAEKKNPPKNDDTVEEALSTAGKKHFPEDFKFDEIGTIEHEETYFHAFVGYPKDGNYRVLIFDNSPAYLGFYAVEYEPVDYEESTVLLDDGAEGFFNLRLGKDGPLDKIMIDGIATPFVKNENLTQVSKQMTATETKPTIAYREWTLRAKGREIPVTAIFVKKTGSKVYLKDQKRGITKDFSVSMLSKEDIEYLREIDAL
ncbi:MAG: hypothetical protein CBE26_03320 [Kiritimatiellaceae bacterium TMED266]|nr:MAG: hypothetical protein CBE26_03320 [Kiritimatiellaceae bacterium TMED266]